MKEELHLESLGFFENGWGGWLPKLVPLPLSYHKCHCWKGLQKCLFKVCSGMGAESKATHLFSTAYVEEVGVWLLQEANTRSNVATAIQALPAETASSAGPGFQYWKIRDYANAYSTGSVTPLEVRASSKSWIHPDQI
jgi:hypothetical protein